MARIGDGLYIASKNVIIQDLLALDQQQSTDTSPEIVKLSSPKGHAMVRVRVRNWKRVLSHFQLGWAENGREACLNNLSMLSNVARAHTAGASSSTDNGNTGIDPSAEVLRQAEALYGCRFFCPDGGRYLMSPDGKSMISSVHGSVLNPTQQPSPSSKGPLGRALQDFGGATAELSFLEDGLHAVLTIERK